MKHYIRNNVRKFLKFIVANREKLELQTRLKTKKS